MSLSPERRPSGTTRLSSDGLPRGEHRLLEPVEDSQPATRIELCGDLFVRIKGRDLTPLLPGWQGRVLFAYLVLNRRRPVSRDELIGALWPGDDAPASPAAGLSSVLARLRRAVGSDVIVGRAQLSLQLDPDAEIDVELVEHFALQAERALDRGEDPHAAATAADAGLRILERRLLANIDAPWVDDKRVELDEMEARLLESRARAGLAIGGGELVNAESAGRTLTVHHRFRECGYALLMDVHARRGNDAEALRTYDRLRVLLRDELGTTPSPSLTAQHERLLRAGGPEMSAGPTSVAAGATRDAGSAALPARLAIGQGRAFVGRSRELERLRAAWREADKGCRQLAVLVGDPGIGKTWLAARFAQEVHVAGATVLYGACDEETVVPYQPFMEALRHYLQHSDWTPDEEDLRPELQALGQLVPEVRRLAGDPSDTPHGYSQSQRYWLFEAVTGVLSRWASSRPLLLVLDDLHWAEKPTLLMLRHVLRHAATARLMVLAGFRQGAWRTDEAAAGLLLEPEGRGIELGLEGLDEDATDAIVAARLPAPATNGFVRALRAKTNGNPFFIEEALRSLTYSGVLGDDPVSERLVEQMNVPKRVQELTVRRLGRISPESVEAVTVASVIARASGEFDLGTLEAVLDEPSDGVLAAVEEAIGIGLVVELQERLDSFTFCHALVRDAIYACFSRSRCVRLHQRVGEALEAGSAGRAVPPAELAYHFWTARELVGPERTLHQAERAGAEAARALAYEEAAVLYRRALEAFEQTGSEDEVRRCDLLLALGRVQWQAGERAAMDSYREVAASAQRRRSPEQLARAALGLGDRYWEVDVLEVRGYLTDALRMLSDEDSVLRVRVLARLGEILHFTADYTDGMALSLEAVQMARRLTEACGPGDAEAQAAARSARLSAVKGRHVALSDIAHLNERLRLIHEARSLTDVDRELSGEVLQWWLFDLLELGDVSTARAVHADLSGLAKELRQPLFQHVATAWEGVFALLSGDVAASERLAAETYAFGQRAHNRDAWSTLNAQLLALRRLQGRVGEMLPDLERLSTGAIAPWPWRVALAVAYLETGAVDDGRAGYERFARRSFGSVPRDYLWLTTTALLSEACAALDDRPGAAVLYGKLAPYADRYVQVGLAACWGSVERYLGVLADTLQDGDAAEAHFERALERNGALQAPLLLATTQCDYGRLLLRRGDRRRAADLGAAVEDLARTQELSALAESAAALRR